ncbi:unnamed protein product [Phytophthora fragariaefolia]|uniref:Unnamed protein product n=1 Tax=Phytophthora fragariaefolia TaxID=1490495 RepID=A0A9W6XG96_9STRA|nr:unnamed protein product [Phytophthora fragariaefolia]
MREDDATRESGCVYACTGAAEVWQAQVRVVKAMASVAEQRRDSRMKLQGAQGDHEQVASEDSVQPVYEFVSAPELTAWDQGSLVNWRREHERYVEKMQQKCRTSNEPFDAAVMPVRDTVRPKLLRYLARYVLRKAVEDITDADIMAKVRERTSTLQNGHIPDVQSFFKANLRMNMSEKDIDARVLNDTGYRDWMKQRCKLLIAGLAPAMLKVEIEQLVLMQRKDAKAGDIALRDLILERATAQQHNHLVHPTKLDNPVAVERTGGKVDHCHFECTVDLLLGTKAGPVHVRRVKCLVLPGTEEEFLLGDDLLKSLGIDVDGMIKQLAVGSLEQDDGDDLDDEPQVGRDEADSVAESLGALI